MGRDYQFEVQYLLSLMVVVLGLTTSNLDGLLSTVVGVGFLIVSSTHLVLLTVYYSIEDATGNSNTLTKEIKRYSIWTLQITTLSFIYLIFHLICYYLINRYARPLWVFPASQALFR